MLWSWEHAESHKQFLNSSELIQILVYFQTLWHGTPCSYCCMLTSFLSATLFDFWHRNIRFNLQFSVNFLWIETSNIRTVCELARSWLICLQQCGICDDACGYCLLSYQRCGFSPSFNGLVLSDIVGLWSHQGLSAIHHYTQWCRGGGV